MVCLDGAVFPILRYEGWVESSGWRAHLRHHLQHRGIARAPSSEGGVDLPRNPVKDAKGAVVLAATFRCAWWNWDVNRFTCYQNERRLRGLENALDFEAKRQPEYGILREAADEADKRRGEPPHAPAERGGGGEGAWRRLVARQRQRA